MAGQPEATPQLARRVAAVLEAADLTYSTNPSRQSEQSGTFASVSPAIGSQVSPETKSSRGS